MVSISYTLFHLMFEELYDIVLLLNKSQVSEWSVSLGTKLFVTPEIGSI